MCNPVTDSHVKCINTIDFKRAFITILDQSQMSFSNKINLIFLATLIRTLRSVSFCKIRLHFTASVAFIMRRLSNRIIPALHSKETNFLQCGYDGSCISHRKIKHVNLKCEPQVLYCNIYICIQYIYIFSIQHRNKQENQFHWCK